jgi:hypothetical protein
MNYFYVEEDEQENKSNINEFFVLALACKIYNKYTVSLLILLS